VGPFVLRCLPQPPPRQTSLPIPLPSQQPPNNRLHLNYLDNQLHLNRSTKPSPTGRPSKIRDLHTVRYSSPLRPFSVTYPGRPLSPLPVQQPSRILIERSRLISQRYIFSARTAGILALSALPAPLIICKTNPAVRTPVPASRARRRYRPLMKPFINGIGSSWDSIGNSFNTSSSFCLSDRTTLFWIPSAEPVQR
jgi:hypothetical protein